jgi:hypothetical protein
MQQRLNASMIEEDTITSAVADSFASMIDDILVAYGASQMVISEDMTSTSVVGYADAVRVGEPAYIYATVAFNAIVIVLMIFEAIRTGNWSGLLKLDYTNIKSVIVSFSADGGRNCQAFLISTPTIECQGTGGRF